MARPTVIFFRIIIGVEGNILQKNEIRRNALPPKNFRTFINFTAGF